MLTGRIGSEYSNCATNLYTTRNNLSDCPNSNAKIDTFAGGNHSTGRMPFISTPIEGLLIFEPKVFEDERGYFFESFNERTFMREAGVEVHFVQDNQALSTKGVFRGLHFQHGDAAQAKLVRVLSGEVYDIVVDIRDDSPTRGQSYGIVLSAANKRQLFIPRGFAHGFWCCQRLQNFSTNAIITTNRQQRAVIDLMILLSGSNCLCCLIWIISWQHEIKIGHFLSPDRVWQSLAYY